jgi:hypothetical protein
MSGQNANAVRVKIPGADGVPNSVVDCGTTNPTPLPGSAAQTVTVSKGANSQVQAVHGSTTGIVFDSPA